VPVFAGGLELFSVGGEDAGQDATVSRARNVQANLNALQQGGAFAQSVIFNLFDGAGYTATQTEVRNRSEHGFTWVGKLNGVEFGDVVLVIRDGQITGSINAGGQAYRVSQALQGQHRIEQMNAAAFPEEGHVDAPTDMIFPPITESPALDLRGQARADAPLIDVLVAYSDDAAEQARLAGKNIETEIDLAAEEANTAYANSGIALRIRIVHKQMASYLETGILDMDLEKLRSRQGTRDSNGELDEVLDLRETYKADLVSLWLSDRAIGACGYGYTLNPVTAHFHSYAFNVVRRGCAGAPIYSFIHELGHNMGAEHDRGAKEGAYSHSRGYVHNTGIAATSWRTIMAYEDSCKASGISCGRILYFSNPDVLYNGVATGSASANNALTLNQTAAVVERFMGVVLAEESIQYFTVYSDGVADLILSGTSGLEATPWITLPEPGLLINRVLPSGGSIRVPVKVSYRAAPVGASAGQLQIHSNDPDENPALLAITIKQEISADDPKPVFKLMTNKLYLPVEVTSMGVLGVNFHVLPGTLTFQVDDYTRLPNPPLGELAQFIPENGQVQVPLVEVVDRAGNLSLWQATMQLLPNTPGAIQFAVTGGSPLDLTPNQ
jgi:hypothetical protein